ncbi:hypothetical protein J6590_051338 [Homalodisca vitripennis]|nr:hypothetical protein J6590_051338 [Homalodisca vitripennis]
MHRPLHKICALYRHVLHAPENVSDWKKFNICTVCANPCQDQHFGTRAPPRELQFENSVMPPDPGFVRVQTPPRVITLDEHYFPSADDEFLRHPPAEPVAKSVVPPTRPTQINRALDMSSEQRSGPLVQFRFVWLGSLPSLCQQ